MAHQDDDVRNSRLINPEAFEDKPSAPRKEPGEDSTFLRDLERLINRHSMEKGSNTPDFILAEYLRNCLAAFNQASTARERWFGCSLSIGGKNRR